MKKIKVLWAVTLILTMAGLSQAQVLFQADLGDGDIQPGWYPITSGLAGAEGAILVQNIDGSGIDVTLQPSPEAITAGLSIESRTPGGDHPTLAAVQMDFLFIDNANDGTPEADTHGRTCLSVQGKEDHAWLSADTLLMGRDAKLFTFDTATGDGWMPFADFEEAGLSDISRIAVGPDGNKIIIVAESN